MRKTIPILLSLVLALALVACSDFTKNAYRTVASAHIAYDTIMSAAGDAYAAGAIDDEAKAKFIKYGNAVRAVLDTSRIALETYIVAGEGEGDAKTKLIAALAQLSLHLGELQDLASELLGTFNPKVEV